MADKYEKDPVAKDSDNEKRIKKAEAAAEKGQPKTDRKDPVAFGHFEETGTPPMQRQRTGLGGEFGMQEVLLMAGQQLDGCYQREHHAGDATPSSTGPGTAQSCRLQVATSLECLLVSIVGVSSELSIDPLSVYFVNSRPENDSLNNIAECECISSTPKCYPQVGNFMEEVNVLLENYVVHVEPHQAINSDNARETNGYPLVKGRLRQHADFWQEELKASPFVV